MQLNKKLVAILILASLPIANSQASWMRSEGEFAGSMGLMFKDNGNFFDRQGTSMRNNCGGGVNIPLYAEYGKSYYHTFYASTSLDSFNCGVTKMQGLNDIETGVRGHLDYFTDHNWDIAAIFPQHISPNGATFQPKHFGIKAGIHSSTRMDPYQSFLTEQEIAQSVFSYGAGIKYWTGDVPSELWGYLSYGHILTESDWAKEIGGWSLTARMDLKSSLSKEHTTQPGNGLIDPHDRFSLVTGQLGLNRSLNLTESVYIGLEQGLWGRNISYPSGVFVTYSKVWRNQ